MQSKRHLLSVDVYQRVMVKRNPANPSTIHPNEMQGHALAFSMMSIAAIVPVLLGPRLKLVFECATFIYSIANINPFQATSPTPVSECETSQRAFGGLKTISQHSHTLASFRVERIQAVLDVLRE